MADKYDRETRSKMMSACKSRGNRSTEMTLLAHLRRAGITGWRRHLPLPGRPDFSFPSRKVAVFVDGCFWHGCPYCRRAPKSNTEFWDRKCASNRRRDRVVNKTLRQKRWTVIRIWECKLKSPAHVTARITRALKTAEATAGRG